MSTTTRIENGIEWFPAGPANDDEDCQCARCGSSAMWVNCANCGGDGEVEHDAWDYCGDGYFARCDWCRGKGGSWHCVSSPEWCAANPLPGREQIESTALNAQAWSDVL